MKDVREGFISVNEAAKRAGLSRQGVVARLDPAHPDCIPALRFENRGAHPSYRIPEGEFAEWLEAHRVQ